jgi:N-acetylglucosamine-6-phosphate deacetylase
MQIHARHYASGETIAVHCADGLIQSIGPVGHLKADLEAGWVAPAFFDLQINGCLGHNFSSADLTSDQMSEVVAACRSHGIAGFCPTVITGPHTALMHAFRVLGTVNEIEWLHLEGPYISPEDGPRGAHSRQHVRRPDWDEFLAFQEAAQGRIRMVTLAPEIEGALPFIERLVKSRVVVAIGHTAATSGQIDDAVRAGARLSTHLGNGCHAVLPRHDNYLWAQLADDRLWASIICDGHHLPASVLRCILRVKSSKRLILTCDVSSLAGLPPGRYRHWDQEFEVTRDGPIRIPSTSRLAGSAFFTDRCVAHVLETLECSLAEAIDMAGRQPRELLGLPERRLEPGYPADLVLFNWDENAFAVTGTLVAGQHYPGPATSQYRSD